MENIIEKARNASLVALGLIMAVAVGAFGIFILGGMLAIGLLAIPVGALAIMLMPKGDVEPIDA